MCLCWYFSVRLLHYIPYLARLLLLVRAGEWRDHRSHVAPIQKTKAKRWGTNLKMCSWKHPGYSRTHPVNISIQDAIFNVLFCSRDKQHYLVTLHWAWFLGIVNNFNCRKTRIFLYWYIWISMQFRLIRFPKIIA